MLLGDRFSISARQSSKTLAAGHTTTCEYQVTARHGHRGQGEGWLLTDIGVRLRACLDPGRVLGLREFFALV